MILCFHGTDKVPTSKSVVPACIQSPNALRLPLMFKCIWMEVSAAFDAADDRTQTLMQRRAANPIIPRQR